MIIYPIHNAMIESAPHQVVGKWASDGVVCNRLTSSAVKATSYMHTYKRKNVYIEHNTT